jgi:hypothetical protein
MAGVLSSEGNCNVLGPNKWFSELSLKDKCSLIGGVCKGRYHSQFFKSCVTNFMQVIPSLKIYQLNNDEILQLIL